VFTREEETTFGGALNLDFKQIKAKQGVILDGDEQVYNIFVSSPTLFTIDAEIIGRGAHAGVEPEKGISAIKIAAEVINKLKLGRIDKETTANIGLINGGSARNAVPEKVILAGEIRSRNKKKLVKLVASCKQVFNGVVKKYSGAKINLQLNKDFEGFKLDKNHQMVSLVSKTMKDMGITPILKDSGGGSDANVFHQRGISVVVIGVGYWEAHSTREYLVIPQMVQAAQVCEKLITTI
jgi:tripeptide aminopeptidase